MADGFRDDVVRWRCCRDRSILWPMDRVPAAMGKCAHSPKRVSEKIIQITGRLIIFGHNPAFASAN